MRSPQPLGIDLQLRWNDQTLTSATHDLASPITVGDLADVDYRLSFDELTVGRFTLVEPHPAGPVLRLTDAMTLTVRQPDGRVLGQAELKDAGRVTVDLGDEPTVYRYALREGERVSVGLGPFELRLSLAERLHWRPVGLGRTLDVWFGKIVAISLVAHLFVVLALTLTPQLPTGLEGSLFTRDDRFTQLILNPPDTRRADHRFDLTPKVMPQPAQDHQTASDRFGKPVDRKVTLSSSGPSIDLAKDERDRRRALGSGIFKALGSGGGLAASVFSGSLGNDINNAVAGLAGPAASDAGGLGGVDSRHGAGAFIGGGLRVGGILGGPGSGHPSGTRLTLGGPGRTPGSGPDGPVSKPGDGLTKGEVARVLSRAENMVRYCYEKELNAKPNLHGKVLVAFSIDGTGRVDRARVRVSTLQDGAVEGCILNVVQRLLFPKPRGGNRVDVNYPWIFKRSG